MKKFVSFLFFVGWLSTAAQCDNVCSLEFNQDYIEETIPYIFYLQKETEVNFCGDTKVKQIIKERRLSDSAALDIKKMEAKELYRLRNHISYKEIYSYDENNMLVSYELFTLDSNPDFSGIVILAPLRIEKKVLKKEAIYSYYENDILKKQFSYRNGLLASVKTDSCLVTYKYDNKKRKTEASSQNFKSTYRYYKDSTVMRYSCVLDYDNTIKQFRCCKKYKNKKLITVTFSDELFPEDTISYTINYSENGKYLEAIIKNEFGKQNILITVFYKFLHGSNNTEVSAAIEDKERFVFYSFYNDGKVRSIKNEIETIYYRYIYR